MRRGSVFVYYGGAHHEEGNERLVHPDPYADLVIDSLVQVCRRVRPRAGALVGD